LLEWLRLSRRDILRRGAGTEMPKAVSIVACILALGGLPYAQRLLDSAGAPLVPQKHLERVGGVLQCIGVILRAVVVAALVEVVFGVGVDR